MENTLPKGWVETELGNISIIQSGGTPSRGKKNYWDGDIPWVKISDIKGFYVDYTEEFITEAGLKNSSARVFPRGTILFTIFATIGKIGILNIDAATNQAIAGITPIKQINHKYLVYILVELSRSLQDVGKGVAQKNINQTILKNLQIPFPPLPEQERIVAKLDKLFAQHEKIKKALDRIPQLLKTFRQQVLTQAVTGKLTEQWREGKELEEWRTCELNSVLKEKGIFDGPFGSNLKTEDYTESGVRVVRLENIEQLVFLNNKKTYISLGKYELLKKHEVFEGDIIFSSFIADKIRACILPYTGEKMIAKADCFCLRPNYSLIEGRYMIYLLVSPPTFGDLARETRGATRPRINTTILKKLIISLPSLQEQQEIVRRVESLFAKADAIEARYQKLKEKIEALPQAILHKAFKGELVPQLPTDGDAKDLLAAIMALKKEVKGKK
ncbi:restriction endonuclease subunit S [Sphingobacterium wenxiniae]|uniref:Type I restriction enzyme, S subunit n=1 Tax=Sphingobacterium wenxiniae TaxID=683125 RepID=A0A1I6NYZ4_9SPHI|nr:restriction endonuclease subunit S [Sphingobacterium wenxiniae]SFS33060.1 type I restriction enzyme, S subunit [Sphingobacterium wenxiniae]